MAQPRGMIFLDAGHPIIEETLVNKLDPEAKKEPVDISLSDFDDTQYRIFVSPDAKNVLQLSISMRALAELKAAGTQAMLDKDYAGMVQDTPEEGFDLTLSVDVDSLPGPKEEIVKKLTELKRNCMSAPFDLAFEGLCSGTMASPCMIPYRSRESLYIVPNADRVVVVYSVDFVDETDRAIANVFLQEFAEAQRHVSGAPPVSFSKDPPREVEGMGGEEDVIGYVSFAVFKSHVEKLENRAKVSTLLQSFRSYLLYHIKASKSYLHTRMRVRVEDLLKVLNRARPSDEKKTKKTFGGKAFKR